jgi:hypothetical protein
MCLAAEFCKRHTPPLHNVICSPRKWSFWVLVMAGHRSAQTRRRGAALQTGALYGAPFPIAFFCMRNWVLQRFHAPYCIFMSPYVFLGIFDKLLILEKNSNSTSGVCRIAGTKGSGVGDQAHGKCCIVVCSPLGSCVSDDVWRVAWSIVSHLFARPTTWHFAEAEGLLQPANLYLITLALKTWQFSKIVRSVGLRIYGLQRSSFSTCWGSSRTPRLF